MGIDGCESITLAPEQTFHESPYDIQTIGRKTRADPNVKEIASRLHRKLVGKAKRAAQRQVLLRCPETAESIASRD